ncbi:DUF6364 family protein [Methanobrevibacter filiformis]|uniref:Ribbon-helix-helix protein CopG domain-containing protein n=1 Tax=Methanobrevibacter filiformis TaxID=55758 RepID=A0A162FF15_9EURY|nr:DUF6364 family protein [Methanobrevibacter filiformis]KZX12125.1 hypothetical protein MBFIL_12120 [Methanobrevibacter filiformis]
METKNRLRTTLNLDKDIIKSIKIIAANKNSTQTEIINEYLKKGLESEDEKNKIPQYLIANKNTFNPDPERRMKFAGIIKTKKPFNTSKALDEVRKMEY